MRVRLNTHRVQLNIRLFRSIKSFLLQIMFLYFFFNEFMNQYEYNANNEYEKKQIVNENIRCFISKHVHFDDVIALFHVEISRIKNFNDEIYSRHEIILLFCNFCKTSFVNDDDKTKLNNHMLNIHDIDIKLFEIMKRKQYINWIKHTILHVITIRDSFSKREYIIIQALLYDETNEAILVCIDTSFNVNFIDEFLFSKN